eukprot:515820_1
MHLFALVCWLVAAVDAHLEPHKHASLTADDIEPDERIPFLFEPHEFTLSCRELKHRCVHQAKGLMILKNECYKSPTKEDIQHHLWKRRKKSKHLFTGYHICKYYTCRTFAEECKLNARDRYISTLTCEHHYDHKKGLRYLVDMKCVYNDTCYHRKKQCEENKYGWDVKINECQEIQKIDKYNFTYIEYDERCEYVEPNQWEFDNDLLEYWQDFDVFDYTEMATRKYHDNSYGYQSRIDELNTLHNEYKTHQQSH